MQLRSRPFLSISLLILSSWVLQTTAFARNPMFYALNTVSDPPPNVTALAGLEDTTTTMLLFWTSGGGSTANYRIAYQSGSTAPANCTSGTQISETTVGSSTYYTVSSLTADTQYSFRVCASNGSGTYASGQTVTIKTPPSQPIFRSMGFNATTAKTTGGTNAMTISGGIAIFASALANNIGIGDVIQYSSANNTTIDRIAFIHGRLSSTKYLVKTTAGAIPADISSNTSWSLFRAYTSFNNAVAGTENSGIDAGVRNFDSWTGGASLTTLGVTWYVTAYADANHASTYTNIGSGWTTSATNKLIFTTPWESRHVGTRQRHMGAWSTSYFYATVTNNSILEVDISNVVIEGMQFQATADGGADWFGPIMIGVNVLVPTNAVVEINQNIVEIVNTSSATRDLGGIYILGPGSGFKFYATNNVVICQGGPGAAGSRECGQGIRGAWINNNTNAWDAYVYNNTVVGPWQYGIDFYQDGTGTKTLYAKNNIVQGSYYEAYVGGSNGTTYGSGTGYNISSKSTATGSTGDKVNTTVSFVNAGAKDYHLASGDTAARDAGTNLSTDLTYPITMDLDMTIRTGTWDIGADEY